MVDCLLGLRHHVVVGSHDDDGYIGHLGTAGTHGGKRFVSRRVEEGNLSSVFQRDVVGTDVLRDAACLAGDDVRLADVVEQRRLTVVHVAHHGDDGGARFQVFLVVLFLYNCLRHFRADVFGLESKLIGNQVDGLGIEALVDGDHDAHAHAGGDDLRHGDVHHACQLVRRHEFRQLQGLAFCHFHVFQLVHAVGCLVAFLLAVLGAFVLSFGGEACQSLFHLLCHVFLAHFLLDDGFLEAVFVLLPAARRGLVSSALLAAARLVASALVAGSVVDVHLLFVDADTFLLIVVVGIVRLSVFAAYLLDDGFLHLPLLVLAETLFLFAFLALFLFRFLLGARGLVQGGEVDLPDDVNLGRQSCRMNLEDLFFFLLLHLGGRRFRCLFHCRGFRLLLHHRGGRLFLHHGFGRGSRGGFGLRFGFGRRRWCRCRGFLHGWFGRRRLLLFFRHCFGFALHFGCRGGCGFAAQVVQIYLADRLELRAYFFGNHSLYLLRFRFFLRLFVVSVDGYGSLVAVFALPLLAETL